MEQSHYLNPCSRLLCCMEYLPNIVVYYFRYGLKSPRKPPPECIETRRVPAPGPGMSRCCTGGCFTLCGVHGWPPANSGWHAGWASELILSCPSCTHTYPFWTSPQAQSSGSTYGPNPRLMWVQRSISHHIPHCHVSDIQLTDPCSDLKKLTYSLFSCI